MIHSKHALGYKVEGIMPLILQASYERTYIRGRPSWPYRPAEGVNEVYVHEEVFIAQHAAGANSLPGTLES